MRSVVLHPNPSEVVCQESITFIADYAPTRNRAVAERIAGLIGGEFCETGYDQSGEYIVPEASLLRCDAQKLGIETGDDLFGGVVDLKLHRDKAILHKVVGKGAVINSGYSAEFADLVSDAVLPGFTAFDIDDATTAFSMMMRQGHKVRCKDPAMDGGNGQLLIEDERQWLEFASTTVPEQIAREGIVLESQVMDASTLSVGQISVGGKVYSYHGFQSQTLLNGVETYGGTTLSMYRGELSELVQYIDDDSVKTAVTQSGIVLNAYSIYDPVLSRANFDVVQGQSTDGAFCSGVVDQSLRIGGASPAELTAIVKLESDQSLLCAVAQVSISWDPENASVLPNDEIYFDHPQRRDVARVLKTMV